MEQEHSDLLPPVASLPMAVWRFSQPSPHVACVHVASLFTNTIPGIPEASCNRQEGATLQGQVPFVWLVRAHFSLVFTVARSNRGQRQRYDGLAESTSSFGFTHFTFKQFSGQRFRTRSSVVSQK